MKAWNFKVKDNPKELSKKLESTFKDVGGFAFNLGSDKTGLTTFRIHKRALETYQIGFRNNIIVNGKLLKSKIKNETEVEISFTQHLLLKLAMFVYAVIALGLIAVLIVKSSNPYFYIVGGLFFVIGILIWLDVKRRFNRNVQDYKKLISGLLQA